MIPAGTQLAAAGGGTPVERAVPGLTFSADQGQARSLAWVKSETVPYLLEVETWFDAGCRECTHKRNRGFVFQVSPDTQLMLKSGAFLLASELVNGSRLKALGCACGYETVKSVTVREGEAVVYGLRLSGVDNYGITDGNHVILLRGDEQ